jgi:hypothetical protein
VRGSSTAVNITGGTSVSVATVARSARPDKKGQSIRDEETPHDRLRHFHVFWRPTARGGERRKEQRGRSSSKGQTQRGKLRLRTERSSRNSTCGTVREPQPRFAANAPSFIIDWSKGPASAPPGKVREYRVSLYCSQIREKPICFADYAPMVRARVTSICQANLTSAGR